MLSRRPAVPLLLVLTAASLAFPLSLRADDAATETRNPPPEGMVALSKVVPGLRLDVRYHTPDNFTGAPLPGYGVTDAWMLEKPAEELARVQAALAKKGVSLVIYDAYRPLRATLAMVAWAERTGQSNLVSGGYIARRSGHNHGHTVDLGLVDAKTGLPLDMGTEFDALTPESNTLNAKGKALENRLLLKGAMEAEGFRNYSKEWWHFSYRMKGTKARDVPYACFEPPEGKWQPAAGWNLPGFEMPKEWKAGPCLSP